MKPLRILLLALLLIPAASARPATEDDDGWQAFGHALALVQTFVRIAARSEGPLAEKKAIDDVLAGRDPEANQALAGLFAEATADMPAEHRARVAAIVRDLAEIVRRDLATRTGEGPAERALQARRDLAATGLRYYDAAQFLDAVKRDDALAVELYIAGRGVNLSARDADGRTAVEIARAAGNEQIASMLAAAGAR